MSRPALASTYAARVRGEGLRPAGERAAQLEYSNVQSAMLDEAVRRRKAQKIVAVLAHFLGRDRVPAPLEGLTVLDIGCSAGFIADELARAGAARTIGADIDVPGLARAHGRFGDTVTFLCADGRNLPFPDESIDLVVFNHIYEHVVDPDAVVAEIWRVLAPDGVVYLGLGNRLGVMEPHYRLPFLSYLPRPLADRYVRAFKKADCYYERFRTRRGLRRMLAQFHVWDYTIPVLAAPQAFRGSELFAGPVGRALSGLLGRAPRWGLRLVLPVVPTYLWVATKRSRAVAGAALRQGPERVPTRVAPAG